MTAWQWIVIVLGAAWLIGTPTAVLGWAHRETRIQEAADAAELAAEDDWLLWAEQVDDTVELP